MEFSEVIKNRYSCKKFDSRQIEKEQLDQILEAGRLAPTAKNLQEQRIYVVQSPEGLEKIDKITPCRYGAPTVLAVAFDKNNVFVYPGGERDSGIEDASIVATHMLLAAQNAGVESCWLNFLIRRSLPRSWGCRRMRRSSCCWIWATPRRGPVRFLPTGSAGSFRRRWCTCKKTGRLRQNE